MLLFFPGACLRACLRASFDVSVKSGVKICVSKVCPRRGKSDIDRMETFLTLLLWLCVKDKLVLVGGESFIT